MLYEFFRPERTSQRRIYAECLKEPFRYKNARNGHWLTSPDEFEIIRSSKGEVAADRLERVVLLLEILRGIRCIGPAGFASFRILLHNPHQLLRIAKREGSQQNRIHYAENSDICAYAECENQNCDNCETRVAP